jgi:hypothetical protein
MLAKTENLIGQKLQELKEFGNLEDFLIDSATEEKEQEILSALTDYKDLVAEVAYLAGYKQGIKEAAAEQFAEDPAAHMDIIQTRKLLESLGIGKTKKADSN